MICEPSLFDALSGAVVPAAELERGMRVRPYTAGWEDHPYMRLASVQVNKKFDYARLSCSGRDFYARLDGLWEIEP